jgi:hypothetical protein
MEISDNIYFIFFALSSTNLQAEGHSAPPLIFLSGTVLPGGKFLVAFRPIMNVLQILFVHERDVRQ